MSEMVERVAHAIQKLRRTDIWNATDMAYAAIMAMREPTDSMVEAGCVHCPEDNFSTTKGETYRSWQAMIDEALRDK